jgi:hypothetical protein
MGMPGLGDAFNCRLADAAVAQEDVERIAVHPRPILFARTPHAETRATLLLKATSFRDSLWLGVARASAMARKRRTFAPSIRAASSLRTPQAARDVCYRR